jgi:hypothetical protein
MKLTGNLKKQVENAATKEEKREVIKKAGMLLSDEELEQVSGGFDCIDYTNRTGCICPHNPVCSVEYGHSPDCCTCIYNL